jgi:Lon protease-like protein
VGKFGLWTGEIETLQDDEPREIPRELQPAANSLGTLIADLQRRATPQALMPIAAPFRLDECGWVADRWAEILPLTPTFKQDLLLTADPELRLAKVHTMLDERGLLPRPESGS